MAAWPRWSEPLPGDDEYAGRVLVLRAGHDLPGEVHERDDARGLRGGGEYFPGLDVQAGEQRERPVTDVFMLHAGRFAGRGGQGLVDAAAGLDGRLGVKGQDPVPGAERLTLVNPLVKVQDHRRLGREARVPGVDPGLVLPRPDRVLRQDPQQGCHRHRRADKALGRQLGGQLRPGPAGQRHPGRGRQLAGQRDHRRPVRLADPPRPPGPGQVFQPWHAPLREPASPLAHRIDGNPQAGGDPRVIPALRRGEHDLRPQPVPPVCLRCPDPLLQRLAPGGGQRDRHRGRRHAHLPAKLQICNSFRARDHNQRGCRQPAQWGTCPPSRPPPAAPSPCGCWTTPESTGPSWTSPGHLPRRLRLRHRRPARRRAVPAVPAALRRLRPLLRLRHLLRRPRTLRRRRPAHRAPHRKPPRSPRHSLHRPPRRHRPRTRP